MKYTSIKIFDFDGTLVDTQMPETGKLIWLDKTGNDWPHKGWWGKHESLDMDVFDNPIIPKVIEEHSKALEEENTLLVMLTGRRAKPEMEVAVRKILDHHNIKFDRYYHNDGGETADNKMRRMEKLINEFPDVEHIEFWDDRDMHIPRFEAWGDRMVTEGKLKTFTMHHVLGEHHGKTI